MQFQIEARSPIPWTPLLRFFRRRELPGVETISATHYHRPNLSATAKDAALVLSAATSSPEDPTPRLASMFDLHADHAAVAAHLYRDPALPRAALFLPGTWDPFELAVRAILGQQISVAAARTLAGRLAACTTMNPDNFKPSALKGLGILSRRVDTLCEIAKITPPYTAPELLAIPGIGPWTAEYIAMRACKDSDAFPASDLILRRALFPGRELTARELATHAERWRPYRAYAAIALWQSA